MVFSERKQQRQLKRRIRLLLKDGRKALKKARKRISAETYQQIDSELKVLASSVKEKNTGRETVEKSVERLENSLYSTIGYRHKGIFREYAESILFAVIVALIIRTFVIEAFKIPTGSMIPTLMINDHIFVTKFIYGVKIPFTNIKLLDFGTPKHGEIIVFEYPRDDEDKGKDFIKRVVGLPGDRVRMKDNIIYRNGEPIPSEIIENDTDCNDSSIYNCRCILRKERQREYEYFTQHRADDPLNRSPECRNNSEWPRREKEFGTPYYFGDRETNHDWPEVVIPKGHVLVMGDNRDNSSDGRYWGLLPFENIKGKALIIWWANDMSRLFTLIH